MICFDKIILLQPHDRLSDPLFTAVYTVLKSFKSEN